MNVTMSSHNKTFSLYLYALDEHVLEKSRPYLRKYFSDLDLDLHNYIEM